MVGFNVRIDWLSNPFGEEMLYLEMFSVPFTVLFTVSMINVVNLIDGLDGLAAGVSSIAAVTILLVALQQNIWVVAILTAAQPAAPLVFCITILIRLGFLWATQAVCFWALCWQAFPF